jgi:hypothetical protein
LGYFPDLQMIEYFRLNIQFSLEGNPLVRYEIDFPAEQRTLMISECGLRIAE